MRRPIARTKGRTIVVIACSIAALLLPAFAWVFPEHRDIAVLAVQKLSPEQYVLLQHLWAEARVGHESRLCEQAADSGHGTEPTCIDYAAWTAIAGDHSCSADNMLNTVLNAPWIIRVARVSARLKIKLANAKRRDQRVNAVRDSDLALERTDPEYVTRAVSNDAHFLLARPTVSIRPEDYAHLALGPEAELNAMGTYVWYHLRALQQASRVTRTSIPYSMRGDDIRAALADEAFALHFLQDSFAAGHVTGNWGKTPIRKGTHDYYSEYGVPLVTWSGEPFVAEGDAYMRPEDAERTAIAARDSLAQLLDAFAGRLDVSPGDDTKPIEPDKFDVCHQSHFSSSVGTRADIITVAPILRQTPVPALKAGIGEYPRFRSELGPFFGLSAAFRGGALTRGFAPTQTGALATAGLDVSARFGYGMEGVLNESSDGLVFVELGFREDGHASGTATVPGRGALTGRLRMPFWLVPGDLLVAGPILAVTSRQRLQKMAVQAANGGLIPWQAGIATRFGRLQFVLGREVGASYYRSGRDHPLILPTPGVPPLGFTLVEVNSVQVEFPILDYRLFRTFSRNQSSDLMLQPYVGFDTPTRSSVVSPAGVPNLNLHTILTAGVRLVFDWRHYQR